VHTTREILGRALGSTAARARDRRDYRARSSVYPMDPKWRVEFAEAGGGSAVANPPGFASLREIEGPDASDASSSKGGKKGGNKPNDSKHGVSVPRDKHKAALTPAVRQQKAYAFAMSQLSSIGMMGFMMYMSGNGVQIFSVMMVGGGVWNPVKAIMRSGKTFERFADANTDVTGPRLAFCAIQVAGLAMALYKLNAMGLLPTHASDWVSGMKPPRALEHAFGGTTL
jgi:hypothetical protein